MADECTCTVMRHSARFGPTEWARNPECGMHGDTRFMARRIRELEDWHGQCNGRITKLEAENQQLRKIRNLLAEAARTDTEWDWDTDDNDEPIAGSETWCTWMPTELWDLLQCPACGGSGSVDADGVLTERTVDVLGWSDANDCPACGGHGLIGADG